MTVRAHRAHAAAIGIVDRTLRGRKRVIAHLVAARAENLGVGELHRGVESAPEHDSGDESADNEEAEAEVRARAGDDRPVAFEKIAHGSLLPRGLLPGALLCLSFDPLLDILVRIADQLLALDLCNVTLDAKVAARRNLGQEIAVAVHVMCNADRNRLRFSV